MTIDRCRNQWIHRRTVSILFFVSGMTGLSYEVIWFKQFSHVWGSSTLAMASVVGSFLFALGLGAQLCGRFADRAARPVLWYGIFEIGVGLSALLIPWETDVLWRFSVEHYARLRGSPVMYGLVRFATTLVVIGPACTLMGGTLPLLVRQFAAETELGKATGWLYGVNTVGAALGCYVVGFHLLPETGLFWTNLATAAANVFVGLVATGVGFRIRSATDPPAGSTANGTAAQVDERTVNSIESTGRGRPTAICFIAGLTGCAALILQTVWNRQLALVLGSSTYAFTAVVFVVLMGIGFGSLLFRTVLIRYAAGGVMLSSILAALVLSTIGGGLLLPIVAECVGSVVLLRGNFAFNALVCIAGSIVLELLPAMAMGVLFPLLVHLTGRSAATAGRAVGNVYAWNTAGALTGAAATSVWVLPTWGTRVAVGIALSAYLCTGLLLAVLARPGRKAYAALVLAALALGWFIRTPDDPLRTNLGMYLYGYKPQQQMPAEVVFFREGAACNVLVTNELGIAALRVNGKVDGNSRGDMAMQTGLAYLPRFLNPDAEKVLVIGFGTGTTSGASLLFSGTKVTCCEIEREVVKASPYFAEVNHSPQQSPRFHHVVDDARAFIQGTSEKYDLILSEPTNPWIAGTSNLFTAEFYRIASDRLAPNGIYAQWIQMYSFTAQDYAMVVRTMREAFPHQRLIRISSADTILFGSRESLERDENVVRNAQRLVDHSPAIQADLNRYFATTNVASLLFTQMLLDEQGIQRLLDADKSDQRNSDINLQLEFRAARHMYVVGGDRNNWRSVLASARGEWFQRQFGLLGCDRRHTSALHETAMLFMDAELIQTASDLVALGLAQSPDDSQLLADRLILSGVLDRDLLERLLASSESPVAAEAMRVGMAYRKRNQFAEGVDLFDRLCAKFPDSATCWMNLAIMYDGMGDRQKAVAAYRRAIELDPANELCIRAMKLKLLEEK